MCDVCGGKSVCVIRFMLGTFGKYFTIDQPLYRWMIHVTVNSPLNYSFTQFCIIHVDGGEEEG